MRNLSPSRISGWSSTIATLIEWVDEDIVGFIVSGLFIILVLLNQTAQHWYKRINRKDAKVHRGETILNDLCEPAATSAVKCSHLARPDLARIAHPDKFYARDANLVTHIFRWEFGFNRDDPQNPQNPRSIDKFFAALRAVTSLAHMAIRDGTRRRDLISFMLREVTTNSTVNLSLY